MELLAILGMFYQLIEVLKKDIATNTKGKIQYSVEIKENEKNPQMKINYKKIKTPNR